MEIVYYWKDGFWCKEDSYTQEYYKHPGDHKITEVQDLEPYEIQELINELIINKKQYISKYGRGQTCSYEGCPLRYNVFYRNINNGLYYCRRCAMIINYQSGKELCIYEKPKIFEKP